MKDPHDIENRLRRIACERPPPDPTPAWREAILNTALHSAAAKPPSWRSSDWLPPRWLVASWGMLGLAALLLRLGTPASEVDTRLAKLPDKLPADGPTLLALRAHFQLQHDFYEQHR